MSSSLRCVHSDSPAATERVGAAIGAALGAGDVLVLAGPLGAGKTCLARGIVRGAGGDPAAVRSPTFVLHQPHPARTITIHHVDLYRLGPGASVDFLDLEAALVDGAAVIEWGGLADLEGLCPFTVSMDAVDDHPGQRAICLGGPAPVAVTQAWVRLLEGWPS